MCGVVGQPLLDLSFTVQKPNDYTTAVSYPRIKSPQLQSESNLMRLPIPNPLGIKALVAQLDFNRVKSHETSYPNGVIGLGVGQHPKDMIPVAPVSSYLQDSVSEKGKKKKERQVYCSCTASSNT